MYLGLLIWFCTCKALVFFEEYCKAQVFFFGKHCKALVVLHFYVLLIIILDLLTVFSFFNNSLILIG